MADFGVAHIGIGRESDSSSACLDRRVRPIAHEIIELWLVGMKNGIAHVLAGPADTVHNH